MNRRGRAPPDLTMRLCLRYARTVRRERRIRLKSPRFGILNLYSQLARRMF